MEGPRGASGLLDDPPLFGPVQPLPDIGERLALERGALPSRGAQSEDTIMVGGRMDTDIIAGIESELETALVLSGITTMDMMNSFAYCPHYVLNGVIDLMN